MAKLNAMSLKILELMKQHPEGISEGEIREELQIPAAEQSSFGRRRRELNSTTSSRSGKRGRRFSTSTKDHEPNRETYYQSIKGCVPEHFIAPKVDAEAVAGP